jgi:dTDP-4-dehydrorhamnose 3,5-epimerase
LPTKLIRPRRFGDERGWFAETYNRKAFAALGVDVDFCQDNHSMSRPVGVLRGLHFQAPPQAQAKLVRCVRGRIWDVAVDVRAGSPTYGQSVSAELSAENGLQLYVPVGFAHGFITLEPDSEVLYKASAFYAPDCEGGLIWDDPDLGLEWPAPETGPVLSEKDKLLPRLRDFVSPFGYDGTPMAPLTTD